MQAAPLRALIALVLAALTLVSSACQPVRSQAAGQVPEAPANGRSGLQEVAAPAAVQQISARLSSRNPQVRIVSPSDDSLLPQGPWNLQVDVSDWPLAEAGDLGLGPHLVVQLDQQPPLRLDRRAAAEPIPMPALQPGSHRLTVYAARPWGEAVKSPGAFQQIRLHRVGRNPAELPARGSAQLIATSPDGLQQREPVLIDWLLLDAPLQHLRDEDTRWRLRISVNGDSFLVDRQTPIWLRGFRRGSNAVQLELLDGRGDPLNAPFNSIVREVVIGGAEGQSPAWQRPSLNPEQLAELSGEQGAQRPSLPEPPADGATPRPIVGEPAGASDEPILNRGLTAAPAGGTPASASPEPAAAAAPATGNRPAAEPAGEAAPDASPSAGATPMPDGEPDDQPPSPAAPGATSTPEPSPAPTSGSGTPAEPTAEQQPAATSAERSNGRSAAGEPSDPSPQRERSPQALSWRLSQRQQDSEPEPPSAAGVAEQATGEAGEDDPQATASPPPAPQPSGPDAAGAPSAVSASLPERIAPGSSLGGSARAEVNADGSLTKPGRRGPLAGLREKLGG